MPDADHPCPRCGAPLVPPGRFCTTCGHHVPAGHDAGDASAPPPGSVTDTPLVASSPSAASVSGRGVTRDCRTCGAPNPTDRELCASCGMDLDIEERTSVPPRFTSRPPQPRRHPRRRRAVLASLVVGVATIVLVTGWLTDGLGLFSTDDDPLAPLAFPAQRYPGTPGPLELSDVATLTSADDDELGAEGLVDDRVETVWRADGRARPAGTDELVDVFLAEPSWVTEVIVFNGDQRGPDRFEASGRVQQLRLWVDGGLYLAVTLRDALGPQVIRPSTPVLTTSVRLELTDVVPGSAHDDAAVTEVELHGHRADEQDRELALERASQRPAGGSVAVSAGKPSAGDLLRRGTGQGS